MSNAIDQRVVEMKFENEQFEKGISDSLKSLENLKKGLDIDKAAKGLETLGSISDKIDLGRLGDQVDYIASRFNIFGVIAQDFKSKISSMIMGIPEQISGLIQSFSALEMAGEGFKKFGEKTTSVGTLVSQGYDLREVNDQIERLNWFADETSYGLTDMTQNIAKFTASGKDLTESADAMQGIALWAALSGQNAGTAARAMYQLSQALGAGVMRKEDYKSIQNMSMDTMEFRQHALDAAVALGTLRKNADGTYKSLVKDVKDGTFTIEQFAEHLTEDAWFTDDVMMKVYRDYSAGVDQIYEYTEQHGVTASQAIKELGSEIDAFGLKAFKAGQEARTWQDVVDATKDATSSQWMQTWELIFGDYEQAKDLWTDLANELWDIFAGGGEERNERLADVLSSKWNDFIGKIEDAGVSQSDFEEALKDTYRSHGLAIDEMINQYGSLENAIQHFPDSARWISETLNTIGESSKGALDDASIAVENLDDLVSKVINGEFGNGEATEAAVSLSKNFEDYADIQKQVNEQLEGSGVAIKELTEEEYKNISATSEQSNAFARLAKQAEATGTPLNELIESISKPSGRQLLLESFWNFFHGIVDSINAVKEAFRDIFPQKSSEQLYNMLVALRDFSEHFVLTGEKAETLKRHFRGLFAAVDILWQAFKAVGNALMSVVRHLLPSGDAMQGILGFTGGIADSIVALDEWIKETKFFENGIQNLANLVGVVIDSIKRLISEGFKRIGEAFKTFDIPSDGFKARLMTIVAGFKEKVSEFWQVIVNEFQNEGRTVAEKIGSIIGNIATAITGALKSVFTALDGNGPSLKAIFGAVKSMFTNFINLISDFFGEVDGEDVLNVISTIFQVMVAIDIAKLLKVGDGLKELMGKVETAMTSWQANIQADTIQKIAIAIAILAGSVIALSFVDGRKLMQGVAAIFALSVALGILMAAYGKFAKATSISINKEKGFSKSSNQLKGIISMATALFIMAMAVKQLGDIDQDALRQGLGAIGLLSLIMIAMMGIMGSKDLSFGKNTSQIGTTFLMIAFSMRILAEVIEIIAAMDFGRAMGGAAVISVLLLALGASLSLIPNSKYTSQKVKAMGKLSKVMLLLAGALWILSTIPTGKLIVSATVIGVAILGITKMFDKLPSNGNVLKNKAATIKTMGRMILDIGLAVAALGVGMRIMSGMGWGGLAVALAGLAGAIIIFAGAALLLKGKAEPIQKLGKSMLQFGVGVLALGVAMPLVAAGLLLLTPALFAIAGAIIATAPAIAEAIIVLLRETIRALRESVAEIVEGVLGTLHDVLDSLRGHIGPIVEDILVVVIEILDAIANKAPELVVVIIKLLGKIGEGLKQALESMSMEKLLGLTGAIAILTGIMVMLGNLKPSLKDAMVAVVFIGLTMGEMALVFWALRDVDGENLLRQSEGISMGVTALGGVLGLLTKLNVDAKSAWEAAKSFAIFMGVTAGTLGILGIIGLLLDKVVDTGKVFDKAADIMEGVGKGIGKLIGGIIGGIGEAMSGSLVVIGKDLSDFAKESAGFFEFVKNDIDGATITNLGFLVEAILALSGTEVLTGINNIFSSIGGKIAQWITGSESSSPLAQFASHLTDMAIELKGFATALSEIKNFEQLQAGVDLAKTICDIAKELPPVDGVWVDFAGEPGTTLGIFASKLQPIGKGLAEFAAEVDGKISSDSVTAATNAALALAEMTNLIVPDESNMQKLIDATYIDKWIEQLTKLGAGLVDFQMQTLNVNGSNITSIATAVTELVTATNDIAGIMWSGSDTDFAFVGAFAESMKVLALKLSSASIYAKGINTTDFGNVTTVLGALAQVATDYDLGAVGTDVETFATTMVNFSDDVKAFAGKLSEITEMWRVSQVTNQLVKLINAFAAVGTDGATSFKNIADALKTASEIDWSKITEWGSHLASFGAQISTFGIYLSGLDPQKASDAKDLITKVKEINDVIQDTDDWSLDSAGGRLENFGESVKIFYGWIADVSLLKGRAVADTIVDICTAIMDLGSEGSSAMKDFGEGLKALGEFSVTGFLKAVADKGESIKEAGKSVMNNFIIGLGGNADTGEVSDPDNHIATKFIDSFFEELIDNHIKDADTKGSFKSAGSDLMDELSTGLGLKEPVISTKIGSILTAIRVKVRDSYTSFRTCGKKIGEKLEEGINSMQVRVEMAGQNLLEGLLKGIKDRETRNKLYTQGRQIVKTFTDGIEDEGEIKSPSKRTKKLGVYLLDGLVNELNNTGRVYTAGENVSNAAIEGVKSAISNISQILENEIDTEPVIRPVIDDSGIQNGVHGIAAMFNRNSSFAVRGATALAGKFTVRNAMVDSDGNPIGTTYKFEQNNYSPKALSRLEVYRQTKNQFAMFANAKGAVPVR